MAVHDSKANWEEFRDNVLMPRLKQGIPGGFDGPPQKPRSRFITYSGSG